MNKILFGIIGILFAAIIFVAVFPIIQRPSAPTGVTPTQGGGGNTSGDASYTIEEVATHNSAESCYTAINGSVYDLTAWINQHPGGPEAILSLCGKDGTANFEAQHGEQRRPESELVSLRIGALAQ